MSEESKAHSLLTRRVRRTRQKPPLVLTRIYTSMCAEAWAYRSDGSVYTRSYFDRCVYAAMRDGAAAAAAHTTFSRVSAGSLVGCVWRWGVPGGGHDLHILEHVLLDVMMRALDERCIILDDPAH